MTTISPALADAYRLLNEELCAHVDHVELLAYTVDPWSEREQQAARTAIADLVTVIREVLGEHAAGPDGGCGTCPGPWPCPVTRTLHTVLTGPTTAFATLLAQVRDAQLEAYLAHR